MIDLDHAPIATAWAVIKTALPAEYVWRLDEAANLKTKFPMGTHVRAKYDIDAGITPGTLGRVEGYTDDGRLMVFWHNCFKGESHPDDVEVAPKNG
jgi:hypothetical protein